MSGKQRFLCLVSDCEGEYGLSLNLERVSWESLLKGTYVSIIPLLYQGPNAFACSNINSQQMVVGFGVFS